MKLTTAIGIVALFGLVSLDAVAAGAAPLMFDGTELSQEPPQRAGASPVVRFRSHDDPDFVQTATIRAVDPGMDFAAATQATLKATKVRCQGAKVRVFERKGLEDIMFACLGAPVVGKATYVVERLSRNGCEPGLLTFTYTAEFDLGNIDDEQETKVRSSAIDAVAALDMRTVPSLLPTRSN
jgi:hypothetical protein